MLKRLSGDIIAVELEEMSLTGLGTLGSLLLPEPYILVKFWLGYIGRASGSDFGSSS